MFFWPTPALWGAGGSQNASPWRKISTDIKLESPTQWPNGSGYGLLKIPICLSWSILLFVSCHFWPTIILYQPVSAFLSTEKCYIKIGETMCNIFLPLNNLSSSFSTHHILIFALKLNECFPSRKLAPSFQQVLSRDAFRDTWTATQHMAGTCYMAMS